MTEGNPGRFCVLGLDLSFTRTGFSLWDGLRLQVGHFTSKGPNLVERAQSVRGYIRTTLEGPSFERPALISIEQPLTRAFASGPLTGLWFIVMEYLLETGIPIVSLLPSVTRKIIEVGSLRNLKPSQKKALLVEKAKAMLGANTPLKIIHDEVDAFFAAYVAHRFWRQWKLGQSVNMGAFEHDVWFSDEPAVKVAKNPRKVRKRPPNLSKKKGVIYREGEFLFLPGSKETVSG